MTLLVQGTHDTNETDTELLFCIFIDNKTTDGDFVNSRQNGVISCWVSGAPLCKLDGITI